AQGRSTILVRALQFLPVRRYGRNYRLHVDGEVNWTIALDFCQSGAPELDGAHRHTSLPFEVAGGDLNDRLIKNSVFAVVLQPNFLERLVTLEKEFLIELVDAL